MRTRTTVPTLALLVTTALLGACGGGGDDDGVASLSGAGSDGDGVTTTTLTEEEQQEALLDWAECMRGQGIDMPDPQISEDGGVAIQLGGPAGGDDEGEEGNDTPPSPGDRDAFIDAQEECGDPPMIGSFTEEDREEMEQEALEFSECMRDEGIEDFPDPDFSDFGPGRGPQTRENSSSDDEDTNGDGQVQRVVGPWGEIDLEDPEVSAAFEACQGVMGGPGGGPGVAIARPLDSTEDAK